MKKENEVLVNFEVEELEKRFEMAWVRTINRTAREIAEELPDME
ncbi:hypothetical protein [uncultured Maribacter sp.]|tara:strand:+ start:22491 stop:22622 length:132 start_codon:yes stop_codon:yes gene_type:complete